MCELRVFSCRDREPRQPLIVFARNRQSTRGTPTNLLLIDSLLDSRLGVHSVCRNPTTGHRDLSRCNLALLPRFSRNSFRKPGWPTIKTALVHRSLERMGVSRKFNDVKWTPFGSVKVGYRIGENKRLFFTMYVDAESQIYWELHEKFLKKKRFSRILLN